MSELNVPLESFATSIVNCSRCGGDHLAMALPFAKAFAPAEAGGLRWTHWAMCPQMYEPILIMVVDVHK